MVFTLQLLHLPQPPDAGPDGGSVGGGERPGAAGHGDAAVLHLAGPDANVVALHGILKKGNM